MVRPVLRTRSVGTRVSDDEYAQLESLAGTQTLSEWIREVLLQQAAPSLATPGEELLLAELAALRTILLNVLFRLASGERLTAPEMKELITRADAEKHRKAHTQVENARPNQRPDMLEATAG